MEKLQDLLRGFIYSGTTPPKDQITFSTLPLVPIDLQGEILLRAFLKSSGETISREGIGPLLYNIKKGDDVIGRALHIGDGYFLTALHVIESSGLELTPQLAQGTVSQYSGPFDTADYDANTDLALLKAPLDKRVGEPLIRLYNRIPQLCETVSEFVRLDKKVNTPVEIYLSDFEFQYIDDEPGIAQRITKLILPANSLFVEKQGKVRRNRKNPATYGSEFINNCFSATIPTERGDSGSPIFLRVAYDKYVFVGIATRKSGVIRQIITPNHPFGDKNSFYTGIYAIDREPIESLILKYLARATQPPHPPPR